MANNNSYSLLPFNGGAHGNSDQRQVLPQPLQGANNVQESGAAGTQAGISLSRMGQVPDFPNGLGQTFTDTSSPVFNTYVTGSGTVNINFPEPIQPFGQRPFGHNPGPAANYVGHFAETVMPSPSSVAAAATPAPKKKNPPKPRKKASATVPAENDIDLNEIFDAAVQNAKSNQIDEDQ